MFLEALDDASNNFQKYENKDGFEKLRIDTERSVERQGTVLCLREKQLKT